MKYQLHQLLTGFLEALVALFKVMGSTGKAYSFPVGITIRLLIDSETAKSALL